MRVCNDPVFAWDKVGALTMRANVLVLLFLCLVIAPVLAFDQTYIAPSGQALYTVNIYSNGGTTGQILLTQQNGDVTHGSWSYSNIVWAIPPYQTATVTIGANSSSTTYITEGQLVTDFSPINGALNNNGPVIQAGIGQNKIIANEIVTTPIKPYPVTSFEITTDQDVVIDVKWIAISDATKTLQPENANWIKTIMDLAYNVFWDAIDFITSLVYWIRFFLTGANLLMAVALFLAVPMAFAAKNSKGNPERFLRQYFKTVKGFFTFIIAVWAVLLHTIGTVRGWFRI
jgi:type IV secretory pathway VirB2 component (pilin)